MSTSSLFKTKKTPETQAAPASESPASGPPLKMVSTRLTRRQWRQIKEFALDEETTIQALFVEALAEKMARKGITLDKA